MDFWFGDSANVIHVSKSGNDVNGGVAQQYPINFAVDAKLTIGSALTACPDGGTIIVWPGDYDETVDIKTAAKRITLIGTHPKLSNIKPTTGKGVIGYHGLVMKNISVEIQDDASMAVDCQNQDDLTFINCYIHTWGIDGLYCSGSIGKIFIDNCFIFAAYDGVYLGSTTNIINNSVIVTDGNYGTTGSARAIAGAGAKSDLIIRNSQIIAKAAYGDEKSGMSAPVYECDRELYCIDQTVNKVIAENCIFIASGALPTAHHVDSYANSDCYCFKSTPNVIARGCLFYVDTDANLSKMAVCSSDGTKSVFGDCGFWIDPLGAASEAWAFHRTTAGAVRVANCDYDSSQVHSNVTVRGVDKAVQVITNKAVQNKSTGVIDYYDDSGSSVILTHTPTDAASTITRTPS